MSLNRVILIGRVGQEPEMRYTQGGVAKTELRLATSRSYKAAQGEIKELTEWHDVAVWGRAAEVAGEHIHQGALVQIEGRLQTRSWQAQDGSMRRRTEVVAEQFPRILCRPHERQHAAERLAGAIAGAEAEMSVIEGGAGGREAEQQAEVEAAEQSERQHRGIER